jgi:hypothetical protein
MTIVQKPVTIAPVMMYSLSFSSLVLYVLLEMISWKVRGKGEWAAYLNIVDESRVVRCGVEGKARMCRKWSSAEDFVEMCSALV